MAIGETLADARRLQTLSWMISIGMARHCPNALSWWNVAGSPWDVTFSRGTSRTTKKGPAPSVLTRRSTVASRSSTT
jgi:hypothetical protein